jgi:hypothetical protein
MRWALLLLTLALAGCVHEKPNPAKTTGPSQSLPPVRAVPGQTNKPTVTVVPAAGIKGKVAMANPSARHVIITFPLGQLPPLDRRFNVYRGGLRVGEVRITGPMRDIHIAADILAGDCQVGDEVRED